MNHLSLRLREQVLQWNTKLLVCIYVMASCTLAFRFKDEIILCMEIIRLRLTKKGPWGPPNVLDAPASCKSMLSAGCLVDSAVARFVVDQLYHAKRVFELITDCGVPVKSALDTKQIRNYGRAMEDLSRSMESLALEDASYAFESVAMVVQPLVYVGVRRYLETSGIGMVMTLAIQGLRAALVSHARMMDSNLSSWTRVKAMRTKEGILTQIPPLVAKWVGWRGFEQIRHHIPKIFAETEKAAPLVDRAMSFIVKETHRLHDKLAAIPAYKYWRIYKFFMGSPDDEIQTELRYLSSLEPLVQSAKPMIQDIRQNALDLEHYINWCNFTTPKIIASYRPIDLEPLEDEFLELVYQVDRMFKDSYEMVRLSELGAVRVGVFPTYRRRNQKRLSP